MAGSDDVLEGSCALVGGALISEMKNLYYVLSVLGVVIPMFFFLPWVAEHGLAVHLLVSAALGSPISAFAWADVVVSAVVLLVFMAQENRAGRIPHLWLPIVGLFTVGVSLALPLFLALREGRLKNKL